MLFARCAAPVLFAFLLCGGCADVSGTYRDRDQSQAMEAVLRAQEAAWNKGDIDAFMSEGYLRSPALTFYSGGEVRHGFDTVLEHFRRSYNEGGREMGHLAFGEVETLLFGPDGGVVRGRWQLESRDGKKIGGLFTLVMQRTSQGWRIVHDHTSLDETRSVVAGD
jgi:ketosteroid isomerase-like protein